MMLTEDGTEIRGPQPDVLHVLFASIVRTLHDAGISENEADRIGLRMLTRMQVALAGAGYVIRDQAGSPAPGDS